MSDMSKSADLILKLYEMRRETVMRQARAWFATEFHPTSVESVMAALQSDKSAYLRMIGTYWEMAAALINHGAIDEALFNDCNGEHVFYFAKMEPFLEGMRKQYGNPNMGVQLEKLVRKMPNSKQALENVRQRQAAMANRGGNR